MVMLMLQACASAAFQDEPPAEPPDTSILTSDPGGLLTPDFLTLTPASETPPPAPTERTAEPTPSREPILTPSVEVSPTEESASQVEFEDCDVMTRQQAEAIVGPLLGDPFPLEWIGPDAERTAICIFEGSLNQASVQMLWYSTAAGARQGFTLMTGSGGEPVAGIGDAALWDESQLVLTVVRGAVVVGVQMLAPDQAREQADQIARIAVVRIP